MTEEQANESNRGSKKDPSKSHTVGRYFLVGMLLVLAVVFLNMVQFFLLPIVLAAVFAGLFYPVFRKLLVVFRQRRSLTSLVTCLLLMLLLLIPAYIVADLVASEAIDLYETAEQGVREFVQTVERGESRLLEAIRNASLYRRLGLEGYDWQASLEEIVKSSASSLASVINKASRETFLFFTNIFITFFAMFYFFRDGDWIVKRIKYLSPLDERYEDEIIRRFLSVSRATIKGTLVIAIIKGAMGGLTFWAFGVTSPVLWGVVMVILSIIPLVGAWLVMYPVGFIMILTGAVWEGLAIIFIATVPIGNIDNILLPRLVGRDAGMHELLVFISTIGGLSVFGIMGFVIGPIIAAMFMTILDVYSIEFRQHLEKKPAVITAPGGSETSNEKPS
jgi:predicted PurR-regulated permease PerM